MAEVFVVSGLGGKRMLKGELPVRGAKNYVLKTLAASLLFDGEVSYERVPDIEDVRRTFELLRKIGVTVNFQEHGVPPRKKNGAGTVTLKVPRNLRGDLDREIAKRFRASIVFTGPLLARRGKVSFPHPGGCVLGERPIDIFLEGFGLMGAKIKLAKETYLITAPKSGLHGAKIFFRTPSVTGTETFLLTAVLAKGETVLENAAMEPEILALAEWLNVCGADIRGAGTTTIVIRGGLPLVARQPAVTIPDRIEAGSFLILAAIAGKDVRVTDCDARHLTSIIATIRAIGVRLDISSDQSEIHVRPGKELRTVNIKTHEYPGFPTDLQAPMTVLLTQAKGESLVFETIFEGRLGYIEALQRMGANIKIMDSHRALVSGPTALRGRLLESPDIRAGLGYLIAAIIASGESIIHQVYYIDRGYEMIEHRLHAVGVNIRRSTI